MKRSTIVVGTINLALSSILEQIQWAFIYGSVASEKETTGSDIDLMIIGDISFSQVISLLYPVQKSLGREINPKIYSRTVWVQMKASKNSFVSELLLKPRMDVIVNNHELG